MSKCEVKVDAKDENDKRMAICLYTAASVD